MLPNFGTFNQIMDACTADYRALILDNSSNSTKINDCIFWYKAKPRPPFKIGHSMFYDYARDKKKKRDPTKKSSTQKSVTLLKR